MRAEFAAPRTQPPARDGAPAPALAGLKVVEFGAYAAGPHVGKMLATFGATVVHVESRGRPDGFRTEYPPFLDDRPGLDRAGCFAWFNDSKCDVTLELKNPAGRAIAERLLGWADVVVENMRPGVMARLGLGYEHAASRNPGLVMLSTCNMGQTGPRAQTPGFGSQLSALAGFCGLTGAPEGPPMLLYGPYIDFIASTLGAVAVLAALDRSRASGRGAWIDLAQYEAGLSFLAGPLCAWHRDGRIAERAGNRDPLAVPHDAWRCRGGWLALSCHDDAEFERLAAAIGNPALASDPRFATAAARRTHLAALDGVVGAWADAQEAATAAAHLQAAGVHAHVVNDVAALFADPQLVHRRVWRRRRHGAMGLVTSYFSAFDLARCPGDVTAAAPLLGADNAYVCRELLGMSAAEFASSTAAGAFD
ncbi:MAG: CoA transferase [Gammaproteobacteria bacterium]|nr:CoA transferase [Gammaproteobacteria bacterium]